VYVVLIGTDTTLRLPTVTIATVISRMEITTFEFKTKTESGTFVLKTLQFYGSHFELRYEGITR
jgi:hypothetical protein